MSVDKLTDAGHEVILNKKKPRIITKGGETIPLKRKHGVFVLTMWVKVPEVPDEPAGKDDDKPKPMEIDALSQRSRPQRQA